MAKIDELAAQVERFQQLLAQHGIHEPLVTVVTPEDRPDYIAHGSPEHARFLGLVEVTKDDQTANLGTFTSTRTGKTYRLEAELDAVRHFPGVDPEKAVPLLLQQKVGVLDSVPQPPEDAPPPFEPATVYPS